MSAQNIFVNRKGESFISNNGQKATIIECFSNINNTIQYEDGTIVYNVRYGNLKKGSFRNPNKAIIEGVGFIGIGKYKTSNNGVKTKAYNTYVKMMSRCYNEKYKLECPTYKGVTVCKEWHNFQNFAKWVDENYNPEIMKDWHLDKDILKKGNKIYSPETCCFVPHEVNILFVKYSKKLIKGKDITKKEDRYIAQITMYSKHSYIGLFKTPEEAFQAYKIAKEKYIKEVAEKWKGLISYKVYEAMYNYEVKGN
jgi:hypothetical protein